MKIAQRFVWGLATSSFVLGCGSGPAVSEAPVPEHAAAPASDPDVAQAPPGEVPSADVRLAGLTIAGGTLSPRFDPTTTRYIAIVDVMSRASSAPLTVTPTAASPGSTITVNGVPVASGAASAPIPLARAFAPIDVAVTAPSGASARYTIVAVAAQDAYIKASNTRAEAHFGHSVALAGDVLAVGARDDSSAATGIDGDQDDTSAPKAGAVYVFVRDRSGWRQEAYVKPSNTRANAHFGITVALSGSTLVVGSDTEASAATGVGGDSTDTSAPGAGAAYVFERGPCVPPASSARTLPNMMTKRPCHDTCATWRQTAYLKASNTRANAEFGTSVAISGDTIVVGSSGESSRATGVDGDQADTSAPGAGAVYVFRRVSETWSQEAYLKASNTRAQALFGRRVTIDGDTLAVGSLRESSRARGVNGDQTDTGAPGTGAAYVFTRKRSTWSQQAYLKSSNTNPSSNVTGGFSIAMSLSGDTLAVGEYVEASAATAVNGDQSDTSAPNAGAVYVFSRCGRAWTQEAYIKASNTRSLALFGFSVALERDTLVVGAVKEASGARGVGGDQGAASMPNAGAAYVFRRHHGVWSQRAFLKASNTRPEALFGYSVALSGDRIAVGSVFESSAAIGIDGDESDTSAPLAGAVYVFR